MRKKISEDWLWKKLYRFNWYHLSSNREEVDTCMLLPMNHGIDDPDISRKFTIYTPDTDTFVSCLGHLHKIDGDWILAAWIRIYVWRFLWSTYCFTCFYWMWHCWAHLFESGYKNLQRYRRIRYCMFLEPLVSHGVWVKYWKLTRNSLITIKSQ